MDLREKALREEAWSAALRAERVGDAVAYEGFLREFAASVRRIVDGRLRRLGLGRSEMEDVVQEVLIAVHTHRDQWDERRPLIPWLNAITRYKIVDAARRLRRDDRARVDLTDHQWSALPVSDAGDTATTGAGIDEPDIESMVAALPRGQGAAVRSIAIDGNSPRDAARLLGVSEGALRVAFHRGLGKLMAAAKRGTRP